MNYPLLGKHLVPHLFKRVQNHIFKVAKILLEEKKRPSRDPSTPLEASKTSRKTVYIEGKIQVANACVLNIH